MSTRCQVAVVGAGFAGLATAFQLARRGITDVVLLEREAQAGTQASGRNAALARAAALPAFLRPLAEEGLRFLREAPAVLGTPPLVDRRGALYLADRAWAKASGCPAPWIAHEDVVARVPLTRGGAFEGALLGAEDGVVDIAALLEAYLAGTRAAGVRLWTGQRVRAFDVRRGRVRALETQDERLEVEVVVNAAGAWAGEVAALAGATPQPLRPCRRHLFVTQPLPAADRSAPIVWDVAHGLYFRPEPPGLLLSPCDETDQPPGAVSTDPAALDLLAQKVAAFLPALAGLKVARGWAGLRTLTPDGAFVVGADPRLAGFVWCAGLGGHGVTTSAAVGRLAAEAVLGGTAADVHTPARFAPALVSGGPG